MQATGNAPQAGTRQGVLIRTIVVLALAVLTTVLLAGTAQADTFTVTSTNDSGAGSLREAINRADSRAGVDRIAFADGVDGTVTLSAALPRVTDPAGLEIDGGGDVTVSGDDADHVFLVGQGAAFALRNLTVSDASGGSGGGLRNAGGTVEVSGSTFSDNHAGDYGGAISNGSGGTLEVISSTISGNHAADTGGGIANFGTLIVSGSTISGNFGDFDGGGIYNGGGTVNVTNSTVSGNDGGMFGGGGILGFEGSIDVLNSTVLGNSGTGEGSCGGICASGTTLRGTIVADNPGGNCGGPITDGGYNIDDDNTCGFARDTGSLPGTDPLLDPEGLRDNGGPTETIALLPDSPAVDLVGQEACPPPQTDQRGVQRPQGEACDSGAFELRQKPPQPPECTIKGTPGDDFLKGTSANDRICGRGGNDIVVDYKGGNNTLLGHGGKDILLDVKGKGLLKGGDGNDVLFTLDDAPLDTMNGQSGGNDLCLGDSGDVRKNCERGSLFGLSGEERERLDEAKDAAGLR
jgi:hypothetical protein